MEKKVTRQRVGPNLRSTLGIERHLRLLDLPQDVVSIETNREGSLAECLGDACIPYDTVVVHALEINSNDNGNLTVPCSVPK